MRKRLFDIIESAQEGDKASRVYDIFMIIVITLSLYPMTLKVVSKEVFLMEEIVAVIFVIDYILRWITADYKLQKGKKSFLLYPFTFMAILDIISIIPVIVFVSDSLRIFRSVRLLRALRVVRAARFLRYSKSIDIILNVIVKKRNALIIVTFMVMGYIMLTALLVFSVEMDTFESFFDAVYWASISLMTIGYGDIYTVSTIGKVMTMISTLVGIAVIALPTGIITAGFMEEMQLANEKLRLEEAQKALRELEERKKKEAEERRNNAQY